MADQDDSKPLPPPPSQIPSTQQDSVPPDTSIDSIANEDKVVHSQGQEAGSSDVTMQNDEDPIANGITESRIPSKKDATLREFLSKMDEHAPIIPDAVTNYYLTLAGLPPPPATPLPLARLLALATQKFIADVAADAYQYSRIRASNTSSSNPMAGLPIPGVPGADTKTNTAEKGADKGKNANLGVQRPGFGGGGAGGAAGRTVLTMEDLGMAIGEYGVNVRRGEFYR